MRFVVVAAVVAGCWTGAVHEETPITVPAHRTREEAPLHVRLVRDSYSIEIDGRRHTARWTGSDDDGNPQRTSHVSDEDLRVLERQIAAVRFFERDESGALPIVQQCTSDGTTTTCTLGTSISICSDAPRLELTVSRGNRTHSIAHEYCTEDEIVGLARIIEHLARSRGDDRE